MAYEQKDGQGALFIKKGADFALAGDPTSKRPVMDGDVMVQGEKIRLACWLKKAKSGQYYLSIKVDTWEPMQKDKQGMPVVAEDSDIEF